MESTSSPTTGSVIESDEEIDPIEDIIDYLVRCAKISFKNPHLNEAEIRTKDKLKMAHNLYKQSATSFLTQFGKYLAPQHIQYFESLPTTSSTESRSFQQCVKDLKSYHSEENTRKRVRNRRYKALQKLQQESDYFSEKEMMYRNPLLYEQLIGQYLTDEEISVRDKFDTGNLTLLNMILETVDRNDMRQKKEQEMELDEKEPTEPTTSSTEVKKASKWGEFEEKDPEPNFKPEARKQTMINAPERQLLREEFLQEMYSSFIDGRDIEFDYNSIDNDEQYDDLKQVSQDAEDKYFDSEPTDVENLEEHMQLVEEYGRKASDTSADDPLETFMEHLNKRHVECLTYFY